MKAIVKSSLEYFSLVFAAGFILGIVRVLLVEPVIGERYAELAEMPIMLLVIYFAARRIAVKAKASIRSQGLLLIGANALLLLLLVEFTVVLGLREMTLADYIDSRDWVSGGAYLLSLVFYALAPWLCSRWKQSSPGSP